MGNQQASGNSTTTIEKKQNKRHSNPAALRVFKSTTSKASNSTPNVAHSKKSHPLIKPLALEQLKNNNPNNRMTMGSLMENSSSLSCSENNRLTCDEGSYGNSLSNNRQLLVDFHASAKTPRHVRTIIDDEEDDNIEESFVIMRSNIYRNNSNQMEEGENPLSIETSVSTTGTTLPSPSIPITPSSTQKPSYLLPTSPVSPTNQPHKAASMPVINSSTASPKKKHALKILAKLKSKFNHHHHQEVETSESPVLQQSLSDGALSSSRSAASQNVQHNSSSSSLLKIDSHRSMQSYVTNISSNNTSSTTLVTNGQPAQKVLRMNEDGEYVDEETYSDDSESFNVSESEHDEDDDCIDQFIQGTFVQTMDDSISYLKHSMRNQLV